MVRKLFAELESRTKNESSRKIFENSGMINVYEELGFGFFPLGHGTLLKDFEADKTRLKQCQIMVLGNDFGTQDYLNEKCNGNRESETNPTINNLLSKLKLNRENTFFTNFYLGVRKEGTNTKRAVPLKADYKNLCYEFFKTQIKEINPKIVICLGHEVRLALIEHSACFESWNGKKPTLRNIYTEGKHVVDIKDQELGNRKFIVIPHPCDTRNLTEDYVDIILRQI